MKLLLDTHVFLWLQTEPERLGQTLDTLVDGANELLLSAASSWEIAIKYALGRLPLPASPAEYVPGRARTSGVSLLAVDHADVLAVAELPCLHRDPFDRLLVSQARRRGCALVTADHELGRYDVELLPVSR